ncbi:unnamed protein product, partial [Didymodactylos carnosus]
SMTAILQTVKSIASSTKCNEDEYDKLNRTYSTAILLCVLFIISSTTLFGAQIQCYSKELPDKMTVNYLNSECWLTKTGSYHQWTYLILLGMMLCFWIPSIVWDFISSTIGMNWSLLSKQSMVNVTKSQRLDIIQDAADQIHRHISYFQPYGDYRRQSTLGVFKRPFTAIHKNSYLLCHCYLFIKLLNLINIVGQLTLLHILFDIRLYTLDWLTKNFPTKIYCLVETERV